MDWNKVCRIGIDRIVLSQFEAKKLPHFCINSSSIIPEIKENYYEINDLYHLRLYKSFNKTGVKITNTLSFNPNTILNGNNIANSRKEELEEAINVLYEKIKKDLGVEIDFFNAHIKELEINNNLRISNIDFEKVFEHIQDGFCDKYKKQIEEGKYKTQAYTGRNPDKKEDTKDNIWFQCGTFRVRIYDKTKKINDSQILKEPLSRFEVALKDAYRSNAIKYKINNTLGSLIEHIEIIDKIYMFYIEKYFFLLGIYEIERIKKKSELEYIKYKKFGKDKEVEGVVRSVYDSIKNTKYIFDYIYIIDLVKKYDSKHKGREIKRVVNTLKEFKNLTKFNYLVDYFFAPQSPKSGENKKIQIEFAKLKTKELERLLIKN